MKHIPSPLTYSDAWIEQSSAPISIRLARAEFLSNPAHVQEARRERVKFLLLKERLRGQKSPSYLSQHAREIYGI